MTDELERAQRDRNYAGILLDEVTWEYFCTGFTRFVGNIRGFTFEAILSGVGRWVNLVDSSRVALRLHGAIEDALTEARFANIANLETTISDERLSFEFRDTDYAFGLDFYGDGRVVITRLGSTLRTFHRWYTHFMPTVPDILSKAIAAFDAELHRTLEGNDSGSVPVDEIPQRVKLLTASFTFDVVCHNFRPYRENERQVRNLDVMMENIAIRLPDINGRIDRTADGAALPGDFGSYGRMDYRVSRTHPVREGIVQQMQVMAPSASDWSGLFFQLVYSGAAFGSDARGERFRLDSQHFLQPAAAADAYISFFRNIGLSGFIHSVTDGYSFDTTSGSLA
ncbi:hypothetical protein ACFCYF_25290 [Streptomyces chartreusis]|jgi:hypothetical protein|uniref:hypothetical protein n=1 Tax=Streptomyces chartreusis TaxID=1969 RepID=UPI002FB07EE3|nr:hypothetical protein OG938_34995 [Streptomyces chartreusis]